MTAVFTAVILGLGQIVKWIIPLLSGASQFTFGLVGVIAMLLAVVAGIYASLAVHLDKRCARTRPSSGW